MNAIVVAFTLKGQQFHQISDALYNLKKNLGEHTIVIHGFMPKDEVEKRNFSTEVVDLLETVFPLRLNMYDQKPLRNEMAEVAKIMDAKIYVIGEVKEGVAEEVELYKSKGLEIVTIPLR